ncbi:MAG: sensor histidine kinase [Paramuribaculum sp.]|nr:sensor histidine kinase [Paramuribaculum sp.]
MKILYRLFAVALLSFSATGVFAQSSGDNFVREADSKLQAKEYTTARYMYGKAYKAYAAESKIDKAVQAVVNMSALYHREGFFKEAFEHLNNAEFQLKAYEEANNVQLPASHFLLARERERMYVKMRRSESAREQLEKMRTYANAANDSTLNTDFLTESVKVYYSLGQNDKGEEAANQLIGHYLSANDFDTAKECYRNLIDMSVKTGNVHLTQKAYDKYVAWADSVAEVKAAEEHASLQKDLDEANVAIENRDSSITAKNAIIIGLLILAAGLAAGLVFVSIALLRYMARSRRQKKAIATAQEHNQLKNMFLANISSQMEPTLNTLPANLPAAQALKDFAGHIQELSELEASQTELYPVEQVNMSNFCEALAEEVRPKTAKDVTVTVTAPKMTAPINEEALGKVLTHLLNNAAQYTPEGGKISLEFKKRGPHNIQFIVTDNGCGISEEQRENLFRPFSTVRDLTGGDGLGLPICSLTVAKMNGSLRLDDTFTHGTRFIVELHP